MRKIVYLDERGNPGEKPWMVEYKATLADMSQTEFEEEIADFEECLWHWETCGEWNVGKPLSLSRMGKSKREGGRIIKAEAIRRGQPERIPAQFQGDIPDERAPKPKPKPTVAYNPAMQQHIENLPGIVARSGVKMTPEQLEELKTEIIKNYEEYPRTPFRNRRVALFANSSDMTLYLKGGCRGFGIHRTTQGNTGLLTLEVVTYPRPLPTRG